MNHDEALQLLRGGPDGVTEWNSRREAGDSIPELREVDLPLVILKGVDLHGVDLRGARLPGAFLAQATLDDALLGEANFGWAVLNQASLQRADLTHATLSNADLTDSNLTHARLRKAVIEAANFAGTNLLGADLEEASLANASLNWAKLAGANLARCDLSLTSFIDVDLDGANFNGALCGLTTFAALDLSKVKGLDAVDHQAPCSIAVDTLINSQGCIPEAFLRGCGVPDAWIANIPNLIGAMQPIQFYSCFVSHSSVDKEFARRLHSRMTQEGIRVWFDEDHMKGGRLLHPQIDEAIRVHDKLLLVLSEASMASKWVRTELRRARLAEEREGRRKLFPIRLVDYRLIETWEVPDSSGEDLAVEVRKFYIPDFSNWKDHDAFEAGFTRLLRDLKAEGPPAPAK